MRHESNIVHLICHCATEGGNICVQVHAFIVFIMVLYIDLLSFNFYILLTLAFHFNIMTMEENKTAEDIFGDLDKMIHDFQTNKAGTTNCSSKKTASSLDIKTSIVSFRQIKRSMTRAEKCGHSQQELNILPPSMVYFYCTICDKKTFVEKPTDDSAEVDKTRGALEITLADEPTEDGEMLLKEEEEKPIEPTETETWKHSLHCRVMFTGYRSRDHMETVVSLGGRLRWSPGDCDVMVTDCLRVTTKLMMIVGKGIPVVSPAWILECQEKGVFINPWDYIITDQYKEKLYGFSIMTALEKRRNPCLKDLNVYISDKNKQNRNLANLEDIVKEHGGLVGNEHEGKVDIAVIENSEPETKSKFQPKSTKVVDKVQFFVALLRNCRGLEWDIIGNTAITDRLKNSKRTKTVTESEEENPEEGRNGDGDRNKTGDQNTSSDEPEAKRKKPVTSHDVC